MTHRRLLLTLFVLTLACRASDGERAQSPLGVAGEGARAPEPRPRASASEAAPTVDELTTSVPVETDDPPGHEANEDDADCVAACLEGRQMQATAPEVIEASCRRSCADAK